MDLHDFDQYPSVWKNKNLFLKQIIFEIERKIKVSISLTLEFVKKFVLVICIRAIPSDDFDLFSVGSGVRPIVRHYKKRIKSHLKFHKITQLIYRS